MQRSSAWPLPSRSMTQSPSPRFARRRQDVGRQERTARIGGARRRRSDGAGQQKDGHDTDGVREGRTVRPHVRHGILRMQPTYARRRPGGNREAAGEFNGGRRSCRRILPRAARTPDRRDVRFGSAVRWPPSCPRPCARDTHRTRTSDRRGGRPSRRTSGCRWRARRSCRAGSPRRARGGHVADVGSRRRRPRRGSRA